MGPPAVAHFRELRVWQAAIELVEAVYRLTGGFPVDERFGLVAQIRRAAVSVPSNIAEGHRRESTREYLKHLSIALGSLAEVETQLEIAARLGFVAQAEFDSTLDSVASIARQLFALRNSLGRYV